jgi:tetratricopeptide (TPR) repeat protein
MLTESLRRRAREANRSRAHHRAAAEMLATRAESPERVGRHFLAARELDRALAPLIAAAEDRRRRGDQRIAQALLEDCQRVVDELSPDDHDPRKVDLWLAQVRAAYTLGENEKAAALAGEALAVSERAGLVRRQAQALLECARVAVGRHTVQEIETLLERLDVLPEEALDDALLANVSLTRGVARARAGDLDMAEECLLHACEVFERAGDHYMAAAATQQLATALLFAGSLDKARQHATATLATAEELGARILVAEGLIVLGEIARHTGDLSDAERCYRQAHAIIASVEHRNQVVCELNLGLVLAMRGDFSAAREALLACEETVQAGSRLHLLVPLYGVLLACEAGLGGWGAFDAHAEQIHHLLTEQDMVDPDFAWAAQRAGELAAAAQEPARATVAFELALTQWRGLGRAASMAEVEAALAAIGSSDA